MPTIWPEHKESLAVINQGKASPKAPVSLSHERPLCQVPAAEGQHVHSWVTELGALLTAQGMKQPGMETVLLAKEHSSLKH